MSSKQLDPISNATFEHLSTMRYQWLSRSSVVWRAPELSLSSRLTHTAHPENTTARGPWLQDRPHSANLSKL